MAIAEQEKELSNRRADVETVANYLAKGLNPMELRSQGRVQEANNLSFLLDNLDRTSLMNEVDKRKAEIENELVSPEAVKQETSSKNKKRQAKQYTLEDLHKNPNIHSYKPVPREKLQGYDARKTFKKKLDNAGYNKTEVLRRRYKNAIERLKAAGLWDMIENGDSLTSEKIEIIKNKLAEFDRQE